MYRDWDSVVDRVARESSAQKEDMAFQMYSDSLQVVIAMRSKHVGLLSRAHTKPQAGIWNPMDDL